MTQPKNFKNGGNNLPLKLYEPTHDPPPPLIGETINDLKVMRKTTERQNGHVIYECACICGRMTRVRATRLINKLIKSCGKCQLRAGTTKPLPLTKELKP